MTRSLRLRLLLGTSIASALILTLLGFSVYAFMWHRLLAEFDATQITKARTIAAMVELNDATISFDADLEQMPEFSAKRNAEYFEIWLSDGKVLARSPSLGTGDLPKSPGEMNPSGHLIQLPDGHHGRLIALSFAVHAEHEDEVQTAPSSRQTATVVLAARPMDVNRALDDLSWLLSVLCAAAVVLCGAVLYRIVGRAVAPVNQLAGEIESLRETDLNRRMDPQKVPTELSPVVEKLNGLFSRLDESFARERAFTADVAHELRTPLAGIQTTLEVCRSRPRESAEYESTIDECRAMTDRLQAMIENLLLLARADAGQLPIRNQQIDLHHVMQESWLPLMPRIAGKKVDVRSANTGDCLADIDVDKTRIILRNLLDNAVTYVNEGGSIRWSIDRRESKIEITVTNTGSHVDTADAIKLFDRFWRGDPSRTDTGVHCGLGLSLCQRLIALMNGRIHVTTSTGGDFRVTVELPSGFDQHI
jgi:two-component system heavy metal sensor histidine kinase CusS